MKVTWELRDEEIIKNGDYYNGYKKDVATFGIGLTVGERKRRGFVTSAHREVDVRELGDTEIIQDGDRYRCRMTEDIGVCGRTVGMSVAVARQTYPFIGEVYREVPEDRVYDGPGEGNFYPHKPGTLIDINIGNGTTGVVTDGDTGAGVNGFWHSPAFGFVPIRGLVCYSYRVVGYDPDHPKATGYAKPAEKPVKAKDPRVDWIDDRPPTVKEIADQDFAWMTRNDSRVFTATGSHVRLYWKSYSALGVVAWRSAEVPEPYQPVAPPAPPTAEQLQARIDAALEICDADTAHILRGGEK